MAPESTPIPTTTPQQLGSGGTSSAMPVNAGARPTDIALPDMGPQAGGRLLVPDKSPASSLEAAPSTSAVGDDALIAVPLPPPLAASTTPTQTQPAITDALRPIETPKRNGGGKKDEKGEKENGGGGKKDNSGKGGGGNENGAQEQEQEVVDQNGNQNTGNDQNQNQNAENNNSGNDSSEKENGNGGDDKGKGGKDKEGPEIEGADTTELAALPTLLDPIIGGSGAVQTRTRGAPEPENTSEPEADGDEGDGGGNEDSSIPALTDVPTSTPTTPPDLNPASQETDQDNNDDGSGKGNGGGKGPGRDVTANGISLAPSPTASPAVSPPSPTMTSVLRSEVVVPVDLPATTDVPEAPAPDSKSNEETRERPTSATEATNSVTSDAESEQGAGSGPREVVDDPNTPASSKPPRSSSNSKDSNSRRAILANPIPIYSRDSTLYTSSSNIHLSSNIQFFEARAFSAIPITNGTTGALSGIDMVDVADTGSQEITRLGVTCAIAMAFPRDQLRQERMENITMAAFYLAMFGVGMAAILTESVAHLLTVTICTLLSLSWTGTQLVRTHAVHEQFEAFITRSACSGIDILPFYWAQRRRLELPTLIVNALALVLLGGSGLKIWNCCRKHAPRGMGSLAGIGVRVGIGRYAHKVVVMLRIAILLGTFLILGAMGIWVGLVFDSPSAVVFSGSGMIALQVLGVFSVLLVFPWATVGWLSLRAQDARTSLIPSNTIDSRTNADTIAGKGKGGWWGKRVMMGFFIGMNVLFLAGWTATFASEMYRAVFLAWTFFAVLSVAAFFVLVGSLGAGVVCWMRFGRENEEEEMDFLTEKNPRDQYRTPRVGSLQSIDDDRSIALTLPSIPESHRWYYSNTAEKAWEPFDTTSIRQSQFTTSDGRQSTAFSYGLRSPAPPMPVRPSAYGSVNSSEIALAL